MKSPEETWDLYWSASSPRLEFRLPTDSLKGKQILTVVLNFGDEKFVHSLPYEIIYNKGIRGMAKEMVSHFEREVFKGHRAFNYKQFNELLSGIVDWKMDIDKEFSFFSFFRVYWGIPLTEKLTELWVRIFNR